MEEIVKKIIVDNRSIFGDIKSINKINVGFTNTIYNVNDEFIIKICTDNNNEPKFKNEIDFYHANKDNYLIPKLYVDNTKKDIVPYYYEILEKIDGVSLYDVWHKLDDSTREDIIKQLCDAMKMFHSNIGMPYDWVKRNSDLFLEQYEQAKAKNLFSEEELKKLDEALLQYPKYLESDEFVFVHNDLHFDNVFYKDGKIKVIDFERSLYAPKDYELAIFYRMIRKPWKFASEENEQYTKEEDYANIMSLMEKYYPELMHTKNLYKRLAIYDMAYYLKHYVHSPHILELKDDVLSAADIILSNDMEIML